MRRKKAVSQTNHVWMRFRGLQPFLKIKVGWRRKAWMSTPMWKRLAQIHGHISGSCLPSEHMPGSELPTACVCCFLGRHGGGEKTGSFEEGVWKWAKGCWSARCCHTSPIPQLTEQLGSLFSPEHCFPCICPCCSKSGRDCGRLAISFSCLFSSDHPVYFCRANKAPSNIRPIVRYRHTQQQQVEAPGAILIQMFQTMPFKWSHFQTVPQFEDLKILFKKTKRKIVGKGEDLTNGII